MNRSLAVLLVLILLCWIASAVSAQISRPGLSLPYKGEYVNSATTLTDAFTITAVGGRAGVFQTLSPRDGTNAFDALYARTDGLGSAGVFSLENPLSAKAALDVYSSGKSWAGRFRADNAASTSAALSALTNGRGPAIQANGAYAGEFNGAVFVNGLLGVGTASPADALGVQGSIRVDQGNQNAGNLSAGALKFGARATGEGIASKRTAGGNQNGLDFYTRGASRLSITSAGMVGIGTASPTTALDVAGEIHSSSTITASTGSFQSLSTSGLTASSRGGNAITVSTSGPGVGITANSSGTNPAISVNMTGTGAAAMFTVSNAASSNPAVSVTSSSNAGSAAYISTAGTSGHALELATGNSANTASTLKVTAGSPRSLAAEFIGRVAVSGLIAKGGGSFKIDHPLDPLNKNLYHSFVESPDMKNIYDGVVVLDSKGRATVQLPKWFGALNRDFRYQLTCLGGYAPVYISREIKGNSFSIAGGRKGLKVSWQVTGIRQDAYAKSHRIQVEAAKSPEEKGRPLYTDTDSKPTR